MQRTSAKKNEGAYLPFLAAKILNFKACSVSGGCHLPDTRSLGSQNTESWMINPQPVSHQFWPLWHFTSLAPINFLTGDHQDFFRIIFLLLPPAPLLCNSCQWWLNFGHKSKIVRHWRFWTRQRSEIEREIPWIASELPNSLYERQNMNKFSCWATLPKSGCLDCLWEEGRSGIHISVWIPSKHWVGCLLPLFGMPHSLTFVVGSQRWERTPASPLLCKIVSKRYTVPPGTDAWWSSHKEP